MDLQSNDTDNKIEDIFSNPPLSDSIDLNQIESQQSNLNQTESNEPNYLNVFSSLILDQLNTQDMSALIESQKQMLVLLFFQNF